MARPGCHLCDDARPMVHSAVTRAGGILEEVDVDGDDSLVVEFGLRIPVLLGPDGSVLVEGEIARSPLRRAVRRAMR
ncbi:MAG: glutaredoxin family protein [Acidimicrobiia bacterium]|nr:glutaredoxin family protein [Acidimicrobiia bacterium]MDH3463971.1 glutaredoxin family protein [Acidimicrobiia bacterium]